MDYVKLRKEILKEYEEVKNITEVARRLSKKYEIDVAFDSFRRGVSMVMKKYGTPEEVITTATTTATKTNQYNRKKFVLSAWNKKGYMMDIEEYCHHYKLPLDDISSYKLVSHTGTPFYNIAFRTNEVFREDLTEEFISEAVGRLSKPVLVSYPKIEKSVHTLRVVFTDAHIAMETNSGGFGLYGGVWNEDELKDRGKLLIDMIYAQASVYGSFEEIHLIDLGDFMDGWDAMTVRKGHDLPQNMDNQKAFEVGLNWKIDLLHSIVEMNIAPKIKMYNVCNDNHAGAFGYTVNYAVKKHIETVFPDVIEVHNLRTFISHYTYGKHCFIQCHGKDDKHLKFGFKPILDKKGEDKIKEYIDFHKLSGYYITFEKGDSHQELFDHNTSDLFNYHNHMAFSPASEWIQTNFKKGRSGFNLQVLDKEKKAITMTSFEFDWKKSA